MERLDPNPAGILSDADRCVQESLTQLQRDISAAVTVEDLIRLHIRAEALSLRAMATEDLALTRLTHVLNLANAPEGAWKH